MSENDAVTMERRLLEGVHDMRPCMPNRRPRRGIIGLGAGRGPCPPTPKIRHILGRVSASHFHLCPSPATSRLIKDLTSCCNMKGSRIFMKIKSSSIVSVYFLAFFGSSLPVLFPSVACSFCGI